MPKHIQENNIRSRKCLNDESVDDLLASVDKFIEGVYRDLNVPLSQSITPRARRTLNNSVSPNSSPVGTTSISVLSPGDEIRNNVSPSTRVNMDAAIERINHMCQTVDKNLRSVGVFMNNSDSSSTSEDLLNTNITNSTGSSTDFMSNLSLESTPQRPSVSSCYEPTRLSTLPAQIIDLSETQSQTSLLLENNNNINGDDDDVIIVSANINPIVDLCTPSDLQRARIDHYESNRRSLPEPEVLFVDTCDVECRSTTQRRRTRNKRKSVQTIDDSIKNNNNSISGRTPYTCSVCMDSCLQRQPTSTKCGHIFCNECISRAIKIAHKCPLCNAKLSKQQIFRIFP